MCKKLEKDWSMLSVISLLQVWTWVRKLLKIISFYPLVSPSKSSSFLKFDSQVFKSDHLIFLFRIDFLIGGLECGRIYEICGFSGSGKSQICLSIAAHVSSFGKSVIFIDTKNDFSASRVFNMLERKHIKVRKTLNANYVFFWLPKRTFLLC